MENCLFHGKIVCTFDLKDESGLYYEELVLLWKQAAADRLLICVDCGAPVYLAAGPIKEPYFAHYDLNHCEYGNGHETEERKKGKRILYHLLKRSFPNSEVLARYRMVNGMFSTLYCKEDENNEFAVDYRLQNNSLEKFRLRDSFYQENKIKPIYVMGKSQEKDTRQIDWYQSLLQASMGYLAFLDTNEESLTLKKSFGYRLGKERRFLICSKTYSIHELKLDSRGQMLCNFQEECDKLETYIKEEKERYEKRQDQLRRLEEERQLLREKEEKRLLEYRRAKEAEAKVAESKVAESKAVEEVASNEAGHALNNVSDISDLNPILLDKCRKMVEEGNGHLVSKKYYDAIIKMDRGNVSKN